MIEWLANHTSSALASALLVAVVAAGLAYLSALRQARTALKAAFLERQIGEFYGPLFSSVDELDLCFHIQDDILKKAELDNERRQAVERFMFEGYFKPIHDELGKLLKSKLYLVESGEVPPSFRAYLRHSAQEIVQKRLWYEAGINTLKVEGLKYPSDFNDDIETGRRNLMTQYQHITGRLYDQPRRGNRETANAPSGHARGRSDVA